MFHLKLKVKYNTGYFASKIPWFARLKKECTLTRFSSSKRRVPYRVKSKLWGVQTSLRQNCLAALKIKTRVCFADLLGRPCFLFLCCHFLIKRRGVKNFLEPSKIRFKRGFFFFTINQLQSIKKAPQVTLRFHFEKRVSVHSLFRNEKKINFKK